MRRSPLAIAVVVALFAGTQLGHAAPTCTEPVPTAACGDRVIPDPIRSATFLQYGTEAFQSLRAIEAIAPNVVDVHTLAELLHDKRFVSAGGRQLPVVRVTDERVKGPKKKVVVSLSVHANEPAGREGGFRYIENLARWSKTEPKHLLYAGDVAMPLDRVLATTEVWFGVMNADGWAAGDLGNGVYTRENDKGTDLNREFPTIGWTNVAATPLSDPESQGWVAFLRRLGKITTASDIHGELESDNQAYADLMWPAAQWTPKMQAQELQLGEHMVSTVKRKFSEQAVVIGIATDTMGVQAPSKAATGYDVVGYDDGGFMGDWFAQERGAIEIDAENFLSHSVPMNVWFGPRRRRPRHHRNVDGRGADHAQGACAAAPRPRRLRVRPATGALCGRSGRGRVTGREAQALRRNPDALLRRPPQGGRHAGGAARNRGHRERCGEAVALRHGGPRRRRDPAGHEGAPCCALGRRRSAAVVRSRRWSAAADRRRGAVRPRVRGQRR
ncbi:MAG: hypothetical protein LC640_12950 [Frankia sp.]|nr:hypothetical protein [Frankia sp.]